LFALSVFVHPKGQAGQSSGIFQPAFHQALRSWIWRDDLTTFRIKVPLARSGNRIRVSFRAGEGGFRLRAANIALAEAGGALASEPVPLFFGGSRSTSMTAWQRVTSDPVDFAVSFGTELYVSFEADGAIAASIINAFPDSYMWSGSYSDQKNPPAGTPWMRAVGVNTLDIEGPPTRAMIAIGDSITEGYISGDVGNYLGHHDDYRNAWPAVAEVALGLPFANAGASGQGIKDALRELPNDVLVLQGVTDCVILIGTNDLHALSSAELELRLSELFSKLQPFCRTWAGTLLPKEVNAVQANRRVEVNDWIRRQAQGVEVIDFEAALAAPGDVNRFGPGLGEDGIHPTVEGQRVMGREAARVLLPARSGSPVQADLPPDSPQANKSLPTTATGCSVARGQAGLDSVILATLVLGMGVARKGRRRGFR
jgi:lysophospholipase L1-like esterase